MVTFDVIDRSGNTVLVAERFHEADTLACSAKEKNTVFKVYKSIHNITDDKVDSVLVRVYGDEHIEELLEREGIPVPVREQMEE